MVNNASWASTETAALMVANPDRTRIDNTQPWYSNDSIGNVTATQAVLYGNASIAGGYSIITPSATGNRGAYLS